MSNGIHVQDDLHLTCACSEQATNGKRWRPVKNMIETKSTAQAIFVPELLLSSH